MMLRLVLALTFCLTATSAFHVPVSRSVLLNYYTSNLARAPTTSLFYRSRMEEVPTSQIPLRELEELKEAPFFDLPEKDTFLRNMGILYAGESARVLRELLRAELKRHTFGTTTVSDDTSIWIFFMSNCHRY